MVTDGIAVQRSGYLTKDILYRDGTTRQGENLLPTFILWLLLTMVLYLVVTGCEVSGPRSVADRFMDRYYVAADLEGAKGLAEGLAAKKIADQTELIKGQPPSGAQQSREVTYALREEREEEGRAYFLYEVTIKARGAGTFHKRSLLALSHRDRKWRVANFTDSE